MKKKIFISSVILILLHSLAFACGDNWLVKSKNGGNVLCPDGKVSVAICHKGETTSVNWEGWLKGHKKHGDTLGSCETLKATSITTVTVMTPEADWIIKTYEAYGTRPVMVEKAFDPDYGIRWYKLSDDSYNVFTNFEGKDATDARRVQYVTNTKRGIQNEFVLWENGNMKYDVSHVTYDEPGDPLYYLDTYTIEGASDTHIYKTSTKGIIVNRFTETGYVRGTESTQAEKDLYNQYFK